MGAKRSENPGWGFISVEGDVEFVGGVARTNGPATLIFGPVAEFIDVHGERMPVYANFEAMCRAHQRDASALADFLKQPLPGY